MQVKMIKLVEDPCFGKHYDKIQDCQHCWIKNSCLVCFRNKK